MPRNRQAGRAGPTARAPTRPSAPAPAAPQQTRPATTMAPQQHAQPHAPTPAAAAPAPAPAASQGPGLFGQMASTAAGVAVGSSIGHAIGGMFGGGSSEPAPAPAAAAPAVAQDNFSNQQNNQCATAATDFTRCMDEQNGNMQICNWYLEQLKACQAAAKNY